MQSAPQYAIKLTVKSQGEKETRIVELKPQADPEWHCPTRGLAMQQLFLIRKAETIGDAVALGLHHTRDQVVSMYMTLRSLGSGRISPKALRGPFGILEAGMHFTKRGLPDLILFLGMLSVSLAVLNFLPIPVLDGGHFVFLAWEGLRGKPANERVVNTATLIGFALVLTLMVWVLYMDLSAWVARW